MFSNSLRFAFFFIILGLSITNSEAQNMDSIFMLKDFERSITVRDLYNEALEKKDTKKIETIKTAVEEKGTASEKLILKRAETILALSKKNDSAQIISLENKFLEEFKVLNNHYMVAYLYLAIANHYFDNGAKALAYENRMYAYDALAKDPEGKYYQQTWYLHMIASSFYQFKDYDKTTNLIRFIETLGTSYSVNPDWFVIINPNLAGMAFLKNKQYDSATVWLQKTFSRATEKKNSIWIGIAGGNLGNTFYYQKNYTQAIPYFKAAIDTCTKYAVWDNVAAFSSNLVDCYLHSENTSQALPYLIKAKEACIKDNNVEGWNMYYDVAVSYYKITGQKVLAFQQEDSLKFYENKMQTIYDVTQKVRFEANWAYSKTELKTEIALQKAKREKWVLYTVTIATVLLLALAILYYKRQRLRFLLKQKELENEKLKTEETLHIAQVQLVDFTKNIREKNDLLDQFSAELEKLNSKNDLLSEEQITSLEILKQSAILTDEDWGNFKKLFDKVHPGYLVRLKNKYADLTPAETRYILLDKLDLSSKEMAALLGVSAEAIRNIRFRVKKKLQIDDLKMLDV